MIKDQKMNKSELLIKSYTEQIQKEFPEVQITETRLISHGWDHYILVVDNKYVFRFPKDKEQTDRFKRELRLLEYLKPKVSVSLPDYVFIAADQKFGGYPFLDGEEMYPESLALLNEKQKKDIAQQLGEFLTHLHNIPPQDIERLGYVEEEGGYYWSKADAEKRFESIKKLVFPKLSTEEQQFIAKNFKEYLSYSFNYEKVLVHSDFTASHILLNGKQGTLTGIIDFGDSEIAEPALDFAGLWHYYDEGFVKEVFSHYKRPTDPEMLERAKYPARLDGATILLDIAQGEEIPMSWQDGVEVLRRAMAKGN